MLILKYVMASLWSLALTRYTELDACISGRPDAFSQFLGQLLSFFEDFFELFSGSLLHPPKILVTASRSCSAFAEQLATKN